MTIGPIVALVLLWDDPGSTSSVLTAIGLGNDLGGVRALPGGSDLPYGGPSTLIVDSPRPARTTTMSAGSAEGLLSRCTAPLGTYRKSPGAASTVSAPPGPNSIRSDPVRT